MAGGAKGKRKAGAKPKHKNRGKPVIKEHQQDSDTEDALLDEEITALSAIFQDDFKLVSNHPFKEISINLRAHSDNDSDFSAQLLVKCLPGYPSKPPKLQVAVKKNSNLEIPASELVHLRSMLVDQALSAAREGRVMIFNLAEAAQEYLAECIAKVHVKHTSLSKGGAELASTQPTMTEFMSVEFEDFTSHVLCDIWGEQDGSWDVSESGPSVQPNTEKEPLPSLHQSPPPRRLPLKVPRRMTTENQEGTKAANAGTKAAGPQRHIDEEGEEEEEDEEETFGGLGKETHTASAADLLQRVRGLFRMGRAVKNAVLSELSSRPDNDSAGDIATVSPSSQDQLIQKDIILGHLLRLACGRRGPLPEALPLLASQLTKLGVMPSWVEDLVARQSHLFQATFKRVFTHEKTAEFKAQENLSSFWNASPELLGEGSNAGLSNSRYLSDFEELNLLGRGGFGHVVLCKNKLDGRRYAMKKIRLKDKTTVVNEKIKREVATLSRLQHHHVVRYYQAWFETDTGTNTATEAFDSSASWIDTASSNCTFKEALTDGSVTVLYIQMEYCPRTLKEVLEDTSSNPLDKDMAWGIFRQIVDGLVHIHAQGIIHRDLTPNNIFFDAKDEIKIGDFGLAKFTNLENPDSDVVTSWIDANPGSIEGTGQVGTYFYRAPEVEQAWPHLDEKVDMYSLGVILFELWHPFSTAMERYVILNQLKQHGILPPEWVTRYPQQAALLQLLLSSQPRDRPSAREVLRSELVPPRMEDEALKGILRTIQSGEDSSLYDQVVGAIFSEERIALQARTLGQEEIDLHSSSWLKAQEQVVEVAKDVFCRHGARNFESTRLNIVGHIAQSSSVSMKLINPSGSMLELRSETRKQFASWVAIKQYLSVKRYEIAHVYRKGVGKSAPKEYLQGDFDIVGGSRPLAEAEAIKVAVDIVSKLPCRDTYEVRLNHSDISNSVLNWSGVMVQQRRNVAEVLGSMSFPRPQSADRQSQWNWLRPQLLHGLQLPCAVVDRLQMAERRFTGNADEVLARLRGTFQHNVSILNAIEEVSTLLSYLRVWRVQRLVMVDVFMPRPESYFDGIHFQIHLPKASHPRIHSQGMLLAVGGRYDSLPERLCAEYRAAASPGAVGLTVALQKIIHLMKAESKTDSAVEILVCSRGGGGLLKERMEITEELWAANLKATFVCTTVPSLTEQYEYAHENGIKWLVIITESALSQSGSVKVRHLDFKTEVEVPREELGKYFSEMGSSPNLKKRAAATKHL